MDFSYEKIALTQYSLVFLIHVNYYYLEVIC